MLRINRNYTITDISYSNTYQKNAIRTDSQYYLNKSFLDVFDAVDVNIQQVLDWHIISEMSGSREIEFRIGNKISRFMCRIYSDQPRGLVIYSELLEAKTESRESVISGD